VKNEPREWRKFVAIGDSFTEGIADRGLGDSYYGWADRLAQLLADSYATDSHPLRYANLAVRGRLLTAMVEEQVPRALELDPDLVTFAGGVNDAMRGSFDLDRKATELERGVRQLREAGIDVMLVGFGDPSESSGLMRLIADRFAGLNSATVAIAEAYDCYLLNFWGMESFTQESLWDEDRLHLNPTGHSLAAQAALKSLGWAETNEDLIIPVLPHQALIAQLIGHAKWTKQYGVPWISRRLRGVSSGDGVDPKFWSYTDVYPRVT
jgi:lysophospholipase L1-like esterase